MIQYKETKGKSMLRLIFISIIALLLASCAKDRIVLNTIEKKPLKELNIKTIAKIAIPVREQGYSNIDTILMTSQKELNKFVAKIKLQENWNNRENFLNALELKKIDFTKYNFLIYRITEASGSTVLLVDKPIGDKNNIKIKIGKNSQEMATTDMAYYAVAYKISKDVSKITFENGVKKEVIKNSASQTNATIPESCLEWFDGCNSCSRGADETAPICTKKRCSIEKEFECTKWKESPKQQKPVDEPSHHDTELEKLPRSPQLSNE